MVSGGRPRRPHGLRGTSTCRWRCARRRARRAGRPRADIGPGTVRDLVQPGAGLALALRIGDIPAGVHRQPRHLALPCAHDAFGVERREIRVHRALPTTAHLVTGHRRALRLPDIGQSIDEHGVLETVRIDVRGLEPIIDDRDTARCGEPNQFGARQREPEPVPDGQPAVRAECEQNDVLPKFSMGASSPARRSAPGGCAARRVRPPNSTLVNAR